MRKKDTGQGCPQKNESIKAETQETKEHAVMVTKRVASPEFSSWRVVFASLRHSGIGEKIDGPCLLDILTAQANAVNRSDLSQVERMLITQASGLQTIFTGLSERAFDAEYIDQFETMLKLALRAQNQCRATLETLAAIKNPPVMLAKQANISAGPQQVNNNINVLPRAGKTEKAQSKLSGGEHELPPDSGTPCIESQAHPTLEAVGKVDRAKVRRGKG